MDSAQVALNDFQKRVEQRLNAALKELELHVESRRVGSEELPFHSRQPPESVVHIRAQELEVRIRENSVSFEVSGKGDYYEMPDYQTADALADALLSTIRQRLRGDRTNSARPGPV
jgi:hypothetical protein